MTSRIRGGYGHVGLGRSAFGNGSTVVEPRYEVSRPVDLSVNVSVYTHTLWYSIYGFSSRFQDDEDLSIEVSEDGGGSYVNAYVNNAWVAPFDGANSNIDAHQGDSQRFIVRIHKTNAWANEQEIRIRTNGTDEFGNAVTKETPEEWVPPPAPIPH